MSNVNSLYLRVGGWKEIQDMSHWKFLGIMDTAKMESKMKSGKPVVTNKLYQSQKDMISRTKEMMK